MKIIILILLISGPIFGQDYKVLNDIVQNETIYLREYYEPVETKYLSVEFFKGNWSELPLDKTPSINLFLKNFNFEHTINDLGLNTSKIDFEKLNSNYISLESIKENPSYYTVISKPMFNCFKDWVIVYKYNVYKNDVGSTGNFYIYRKINDKWVFYHKVNLWMS